MVIQRAMVAGAVKGDLLLATCREVPDGQPWDSDLLVQLKQRGIQARALPWDLAAADAGWSGVVLRNTWDYTQRFDEFMAWLSRLEAAEIPVWNAPSVVRWNAHKSYLLDLAAKGVAITPTRLVKAGAKTRLTQLVEKEGWAEIVVKPAVSADAQDTRRIAAAGASAHEAWFHQLSAKRDLLVQPFIRAIFEGEWSFVFFAGRFSHAALKRPAKGEWRVQPRLGAVAEMAKPSPAQVEFARSVIAKAPTCLYARVDAVWAGREPRLMELELIEPHLFLDIARGAPGRFADAIADAGIAR
jgi:glutathione synthase/RimK-type ligase-like ATP-grasp enzyme